ncbi:type II toxin-antitoxin system TacA family antitoxin [Actinomyces sp.]
MNSTKTRRLDLRLTEEQDALIRRAAEQDARSISDFVLSAATMEAQRRLADQRFFMLNEEDHARFEEILEASPTDDPKLRKLFDRPSPFGTHIDLSTPKISEN